MATTIFPRFFITHSWRDNEFAQRLVDDLKAKGLDGFFDVYSIQPGDNIPSRISSGLETCDVYIPVLSTAAFDSPWCEWEINAALQLRNMRGRMGRPRIIPLLLDHCEAKIPAILRPVAYVDFTDDYAAGLERLLVRGLGVDAAKLGHSSATVTDDEHQVTLRRRGILGLRANPMMIIGVAVLVIVLVLAGFFALGGAGTNVLPLILGSNNTLTPTPRSTQSSTSSAVSTSSPSIVPSVVIPPPPPPASIDNPMCSDPRFTSLAFPTNGSGLTGVVQIRGSVSVPSSAQPYRYSLFYRPGIVREVMDVIADGQVPVNPNSPNGKNIPIQVVYFQPFDGPIVDDVLGTWDTTKLASGWYSLRLWNKDRGGNFMGCDVYVYVK